MVLTTDAKKANEALIAKFIAANPTVQPIQSTDLAELCEFIAKNAPNNTANLWLSDLINQNTSSPRRFGLGLLMLSAAGVIAGMGLLYGIFLRPDFLTSMAAADGARGLITFLFAFATISVVLIAVIASYWVDIEQVEKRGTMAKEILAILIGIMGTILGFYFGSASVDNVRQPPEIVAPVAE